MPSRHLYFVRHGLTDDGGLADELGPPLNATGIAQARLVATWLSRLPIQVIHFSPLRRAAQTADEIGGTLVGVPRHASPLLKECVPGFPLEYAAVFAHLAPERIARDCQQVDEAFARFFVVPEESDRHEVVVCHGNIIRALVMRVLRVAPERWVHAVAHNAGITEVLVDSAGQQFLVSFNETSHLPTELKTH